MYIQEPRVYKKRTKGQTPTGFKFNPCGVPLDGRGANALTSDRKSKTRKIKNIEKKTLRKNEKRGQKRRD